MYIYSVQPLESDDSRCCAEARRAVRQLGYKALILRKEGSTSLVTDRKLAVAAREAAQKYVFLGEGRLSNTEEELRRQTIETYNFRRRFEDWRIRGFTSEEAYSLALEKE